MMYISTDTKSHCTFLQEWTQEGGGMVVVLFCLLDEDEKVMVSTPAVHLVRKEPGVGDGIQKKCKWQKSPMRCMALCG